MSDLNLKGQQVAADFVAVYIAEQYRHLISGQGEKLGPRHNWDNAHLQVTLLAAFHSGQSPDLKAMFYKGRFLHEIPVQQDNEACVYQEPWADIPDEHHRRPMSLIDYWQFNAECERSGVNLTRRDFQKLGGWLSRYLMWHVDELNPWDLNRAYRTRWTWNFAKTIADFIISNRPPVLTTTGNNKSHRDDGRSAE